MKTQLTIAAAVLTLAACTPKFYPPQIATPESYVYGAGFSSDTTGVGERWWELFGDTTLDALVEQALANNRDLAVAYSRVEEADRQIAVARAGFLPSFGVGVSAEGDYNAETKIVQKYVVEPQMTWEVSLFGALRNSTRAARAEETIGTSFVVLSSRKYEGRSRGSN